MELIFFTNLFIFAHCSSLENVCVCVTMFRSVVAVSCHSYVFGLKKKVVENWSWDNEMLVVCQWHIAALLLYATTVSSRKEHMNEIQSLCVRLGERDQKR